MKLGAVIKTDNDFSPLSRADVLSFVYEERPKYVALSWSMQRDGRRAGRVFRELVAALDARRQEFSTWSGLEEWCWKAVRNRSHNLRAARTTRAPHLSAELMDLLDHELRGRDSSVFADQAEALRLSVNHLSEREKWLVQLVYIEGKPGLNAARLLNENPVVIYRDLRKIYASLSQSLQKRVAMGKAASAPQYTKSGTLEHLAIRYLDNQISLAEVQDLSQALREHPAAVRQFNDIRLYSALLRDFDSLLGMGELGPCLLAPHPPEQRKRALAAGFSVLLATAITAIAIGAFSLVRITKLENTPEPAPIATYLRGNEARFSGPAVPNAGDPLAAGAYDLDHGTVLFRFSDGAEVNLEAPASFTLQSAGKMILHHGTSVAMVPPHAVGFTIDTAVASIRDLGTEFGVTVTPNQHTDVVVFVGTVEVSHRTGAPPQTLREGEGLRLSSDKGLNMALSASKEAFRYPRSVPYSEPDLADDNLLRNGSFENGPLSRTPHTGHLYRDLPSGWRDGKVCKVTARWISEVSPTAVGTVVAPFSNAPCSCLPHGERCLYLDKAAIRQPLGLLEPGSRYRLTVKIGTPMCDQNTESKPESTPASNATFKVGLMTTGGEWIVSQPDSFSSSDFEERQFEFTVPEGFTDAAQPAQFALSSEEGILYFDHARLIRLEANTHK